MGGWRGRRGLRGVLTSPTKQMFPLYYPASFSALSRVLETIGGKLTAAHLKDHPACGCVCACACQRRCQQWFLGLSSPKSGIGCGRLCNIALIKKSGENTRVRASARAHASYIRVNARVRAHTHRCLVCDGGTCCPLLIHFSSLLSHSRLYQNHPSGIRELCLRPVKCRSR